MVRLELVLLDSVTNPADSPSEREQGAGTAPGQAKDVSEDSQREVDVVREPEFPADTFDDLTRHIQALRVGQLALNLGDQKFGSRVRIPIQDVPEPGDPFTPTQSVTNRALWGAIYADLSKERF